MSQVQLTTLGEKMTGYSGKELIQMGFEIFGLLPRELRVWILSGGYQFDAKSVREQHSFLRKMERFDWDIYKRNTKTNKKGDFKRTTKNIKNAFQMTTAKWRKEREIKELTKCGVTFQRLVTSHPHRPCPHIRRTNLTWETAMLCIITPKGCPVKDKRLWFKRVWEMTCVERGRIQLAELRDPQRGKEVNTTPMERFMGEICK